MKNLLTILIISTLIFTACKSEDNPSTDYPPHAVHPISDPTCDTDPDKPKPPVDPPPFRPDPTDDTILQIRLALLTDATTDKLYFYDGVEFKDQSADSPKYCGYRCFADGTVLSHYDEFGDVSASHDMITKPDFVYISDSTYIIETIDPEAAYSLGAQYKNYSKIYIDNVEQQWWFFNQYLVSELFSIGLDILIKDSNGTTMDINDNLVNINAANGLIVHDFDHISRSAKIRVENNQDIYVSWAMNNFNNAKYWQFFDGVWYSQNGYEFDGTTLTENVNPLWNWNGLVILGAGTNETALFWIDTSTGWLYSYSPATGVLAQLWRLYQGDGLTDTGYAKIDTLKPALIDKILYFSDDGAVWKLDIETGLVGVFFSGNGIVKGF